MYNLIEELGDSARKPLWCAKEGVIVMLEVYNLYLGGYLPKVSPKSNVHNKSELKSKYKSIVSLNNANPLVMVKLSNQTQAYALNVKEISMELGEAAQEVLGSSLDAARDKLRKMSDLYNELLKESDEFGLANGKPSRPGGELRTLVERNKDEIISSGFFVDEDGFLRVTDDGALRVPEEFARQLAEKCEHMSMNPMEYVEKKVYSYAHLYRNDIGTAYETSIYSGMLFNSYC